MIMAEGGTHKPEPTAEVYHPHLIQARALVPGTPAASDISSSHCNNTRSASQMMAPLVNAESSGPSDLAGHPGTS